MRHVPPPLLPEVASRPFFGELGGPLSRAPPAKPGLNHSLDIDQVLVQLNGVVTVAKLNRV